MRYLSDRHFAAVDARDCEAPRKLHTADVRSVDRRLIGWARIAHAEQFDPDDEVAALAHFAELTAR